MLTKRQKQILDAQAKGTVERALVAQNLGVSRSNISQVNGLVWDTFQESLNAVLVNYPIFEKYTPRDPDLYSKLRKLARLVNRERD